METQKNRCKNCGSDIVPGSSYCNTCGEVTDEFRNRIESMSQGDVSTPADKRLLIISLLIIACVGVLVGAIAYNSIEREKQVQQTVTQPETQPQIVPDKLNGFPMLPPEYPASTTITEPMISGDAAWMKNLGNTIAGKAVYANGLIYAVGEEILQMPGLYEADIYPIYQSFLYAINAESGETVWRIPLFDGEKLREAEIVLAGTDILVSASTVKISENEIDGGAISGDVFIYRIEPVMGSNIWIAPVQIKNAAPVGMVARDGYIMVSVSKPDGMSEVIGISQERGRDLWGRKFRGQVSHPGYAGQFFSVVRTDDASGDLFMGSSDAILSFLEPANGRERFSRNLGVNEKFFQPLHVGDFILTGGEWAAGRMMVERVNPSGADKGWRWDKWLAGEDLPASGFVVLDDRCYFAGPGDGLVVVDIHNGAEYETEAPLVENLLYAPESDRRYIYCVTKDGQLVILEAGSGETIKRMDIPSGIEPEVESDFIYGDGRLYIIGKGANILCMD